jgi:hypothetical protein
LLLRNEQTKQMRLPEIYIESEESKKNVATWMNSQFITEATPHIVPVSGLCRLGGHETNGQVPGKRLTDKFRKRNQDAGFKYTPGGRLPPRPRPIGSDIPLTPDSPHDGTRNMSPERTGTMNPASPPRRVVSDFKAFGAASPPGGGATPLSVFGAPLLKTGPGGGMFGSAGLTPAINGGMRDGNVEDDDEDDDKPSWKRDAISLDQASLFN